MGFLADFASVISSKGLGLATIITSGMEIALYNWYRKSELSCDRAGLLVCEDIDACITTLIKLAGGAKDFQGELNKESFIEDKKDTSHIDALLNELPTPPKPKTILPPDGTPSNEYGQKVWADETGQVWCQNSDNTILRHDAATGGWIQYHDY